MAKFYLRGGAVIEVSPAAARQNLLINEGHKMALTEQDRTSFKIYEELHADERHAVDTAFDEVKAVLVQQGFAVSYDDRAGALVAALARYLVESTQG